MAVVRSVVLLYVVAAAAGQQECRVCPEGCLTVPRSDGSCPVCICDGVALTDCGPAPTECSEGCQVERGIEGCLECSCLRRDNALCPSLGACPEECQQLVGDSGCPECVCEVPEPVCPPIDCPEDCTLVEQEDGCPSCRCDPPRICPAIPECLRGCIDRDQERDCYICNCTLTPSQPPEGGPDPPEPNSPSPPDQSQSGPGVDEDLSYDPDLADRDPAQPGRPNGDSRPASDRRCYNQRLNCPSGCRIGIGAHGCRKCYCCNNAVICPGVRRCNRRCLYQSLVDGCCRCQCPRRPVFPGPIITWKRFIPASSPRLFPFNPPRGWLGEPPFSRGVFP